MEEAGDKDSKKKDNNTRNIIIAVVVVVVLILLYLSYMAADIWMSKPKRPAVVGSKGGKNVHACRSRFLTPTGMSGLIPGYVVEGENVCNLYGNESSNKYEVLDRNELYRWDTNPKRRVVWGNLRLPADMVKNMKEEDKKRLDNNMMNLFVCDAKYGDATVPGLSEKDAKSCAPIWNVEAEMVADSMRHLTM